MDLAWTWLYMSILDTKGSKTSARERMMSEMPLTFGIERALGMDAMKMEGML